MVAEPGRAMTSVEERLNALEAASVYLPENLKNIEDRLCSAEEAYKNIPTEAIIKVAQKVKAMEAILAKIPDGLIQNWNEIESKMRVWSQEESERKDAVRAVWKRMDEVKAEVVKLQENIETASNGGEIEDIKISMASEIKDVYVELKRIEDEARGSRYGREEKSGKIEWDHKMKRADFIKPSKW